MANPSTMFHAYIGELRGGRVKITTDKDCLSPELIRCDERVFATEGNSVACSEQLKKRADSSLNAYAGDGLDQRYEDDCRERSGA